MSKGFASRASVCFSRKKSGVGARKEYFKTLLKPN